MKPTRDQLIQEVASLLGPLVRSLRAGLISAAADFALTPTEAEALWVLAAVGSDSVRGLAQRLEIDPANASSLVTRLEERRLVSRSPAPNDARKRLVALTPAGRKLRAALASAVGERRPTFARLSTEDLTTFRNLLRRLNST
jgi:DNA-binding MarR family transcriptional regulator